MIRRTIQISWEHRALFTRSTFEPGNSTLRDLFEEGLGPRGRSRAIVFVDEGLLKGDSELDNAIRAYFDAHSDVMELALPPVGIPGGETCKNDWSMVERIWADIEKSGICRHSYVIAIGGGAVLDLVGFAASTAHRGIRHVRMPTTTLSQGDGGVGVKNGVNFFQKKNWVGSFSVPWAIINDSAFLESLPERDRRAGIIEAIKVGLIRDREFYEWMKEEAAAIAALEADALESVIHRSAELHMNHIATGGDPFELGSARPLDFGHWVAHKLEQISEFRVGHGEAVAIGMAVDLIYARQVGLLVRKDTEEILQLIEQIGFCLWDRQLDDVESDGQLSILRGLEEFREHLGGELTITLVTAPGEATEVHEMDTQRIPAVLQELRERHQSRGSVSPSSETQKIPATQLA